MAVPIYALNLFNVADRGEYLAYSRRSAKVVQAYGGRVVALGKFREAVAGEIKPRSVMILVNGGQRRPLPSTATIQKSPIPTHTARTMPAITSGIYSISLTT